MGKSKVVLIVCGFMLAICMMSIIHVVKSKPKLIYEDGYYHSEISSHEPFLEVNENIKANEYAYLYIDFGKRLNIKNGKDSIGKDLKFLKLQIDKTNERLGVYIKDGDSYTDMPMVLTINGKNVSFNYGLIMSKYWEELNNSKKDVIKVKDDLKEFRKECKYYEKQVEEDMQFYRDDMSASQ